MPDISYRPLRFVFAAGALLIAGCTVSDASKQSADTAQAARGAAPAPTTTATTPTTTGAQPTAPATDSSARTGTSATSAQSSTGAQSSSSAQSSSNLRVEVDLATRKLYLYEGGKRVETHPVAVGSPQWPTQTGEWTIKQVVFNPEWIPPDETWAEERQPRKPGDPKNPLGRAQLVYDPPRTIHGTDQPSSIGKNVSHGSIRMNNAEIVALAKRIMAADGVQKDSAWFARAAQQRSEKQVVDLPTPVPITVH
jgi:lipoprotein-anchoring transpeptidase ErfK/SrfK